MERGYETFRRQNPSVLEELDNVYGGERELLRGPGSLFGLADRFLKEPQRAPRMYMACGTEDFLFDANEHFFARFGKELPSNITPSLAITPGISGTAILNAFWPGCPWTRRRAYEKKLRHGPPSGGGFF